MVAVISGNGLGVNNTSASTLGSQGAVGSASEGNSGEQVYVNSSTGNLVIQDTDDYLAALGLNLPIVRTYNSQAQMGDDFGGNWRLGVNEQLINMTGTVNTAGSTITKVFGDESEVTYDYNTTTGQYVAAGQSGADNTLRYSASTQIWTWTDGATQDTETYSSSGQLLTSSDTNGNTITYHYTTTGTTSLLTSITTSPTAGTVQTVTFQYTNGNLADIQVSSNGQTETRTYYSYDSQNRLQTVTVDLSPQDSSISDGNVYTTTYTYDGTSNRITSIAQSDGTFVSFTYTDVNGQYRIAGYSTSPTGAVTVNARTSALTTTLTTSSTTNYNLNPSAANPAGWAAAAVPGLSTTAGVVDIQYDSAGNAYALYADPPNLSTDDGGGFSSSNVYTLGIVRYNAATDTWGSPGVVVSGVTITDASMSVDQSGDIVVAWGQGQTNGSVSQLYTRVYTASSQSWSGSQLQDTSATNNYIGAVWTAMAGGHAVVGYSEDYYLATETFAGNSGRYFKVVRYDSGSWGTPVTVPNSTSTNYESPNDNDRVLGVGIDAAGTALITWQNYSTTTEAETIYWQRSDVGGGWSTPEALVTQAVDFNFIQATNLDLTMSAAGQAIAQWSIVSSNANTDSDYAATFNLSSNTWAAAQTQPAGSQLAQDANSNAIYAYISSGTVYADIFNPTTGNWTSSQVTPTGVSVPNGSEIQVSINGSHAVVGWFGSNSTFNVSVLSNGVWSAPVTTLTPSYPDLVIDPNGGAMLGYQGQVDIYRLDNSYLIPSGATWQSIAQSVYGASTAAAASALQSYMGNATLVAGTLLHNLPGTLAVTTYTTVPVTPYYTVQAGDTWASVTQTIYGTADSGAIQALQSALGEPALTVGEQLTVPLSLSYVAAATGNATTFTYTLPTGTAATATANSGSLISSQQQTTTSTGSLSGSHLTTPTAGWGSATTFQTSAGTFPNTAFNSSGAGVAAWFQNNNVYISQYNPATQTWGAATQLATADAPSTESEPEVAIDAQGDVVVAWVNSGSTEDTVYAAYYNVTSGWSAPQVLAATANRVTALLNGANEVQAAITGGAGAVAWVEGDGAGGNDVYAAQFNDGVFGAASNLGATDPVPPSPVSNAVEAPVVAVSDDANISVGWRTGLDGAPAGSYIDSFDGDTGSWTGAQEFATVGATGNQAQAVYSGDSLLLLWDTAGGGASIETLNFDTGAESIQQITSATITDMQLRLDSQGNALASWVSQTNGVTSIGAIEFNASEGSWGAVETVPTTVPATDLILSNVFASTYSNGVGAIAFEALNLTNDTAALYVSNLSGGTWSNPAVVATTSTPIASPGIGIDTNNNIALFYSTGAALMSNEYIADTAPYYTVSASDTWASIATTLYGSANAAAALQAALGDPTLVAGEHLQGLPSQLTYTTTTTVAVTPYYLVSSTDTWASVTQAVYGTTDAGAIAALQSALGITTLTPGAHLAVPQTLNYTKAVPANSLALETVITSPLGEATTLYQDANGRLTEITTPASNGNVETTQYSYDSNGNVLSVTQNPNGITSQTVYEYDSNGNQILVRDADGNTTTSVYSATDQLLSRTQYLVPDPDGAGPGQPSDPLTTYYVYDADDNLRFVVTPSGDVTEYRYNSVGERTSQIQYTDDAYPVSGLTPSSTLTLATMTSWQSSLGSATAQRTDFAYDFRGQLSTETTYQQVNASTEAGVTSTESITQYVYDQWGHLLEKITPRGYGSSDSQAYSTVYTYDGLGRVLTTTAWVSSPVAGSSTDVTEKTTTQYADANNQTITTGANGLVTVKTYNKAGELTSVVESSASGQELASTTYAYDQDGHLRMVTDGLGNTTYMLYDGSGNKVASITPDGELTQYIYSGTDQLVETVQYATALSSAALATLVQSNGQPANVSVSTLVSSIASATGSNPIFFANVTHQVYDAAGLLVYKIDAAGTVTQYIYDGAGRVTDQIVYGNQIQVDPNADATNPAAIAELITTSATDRHTRYFYDADGRLEGTLDPDGGVVGYTYDNAGNLLTQISYGTATASLWDTGTFDQLVVSTSGTLLVESYTYYANGQKASFTDADGYVTTYNYDLDGNLSSETRSASSSDPGEPTSTEANQATSFQYNGLGELTQEANYQGTVDQYTYDAAGDLTSATVAYGTSDARTTTTQYDALGRVTAQLTAQGSALVASAVQAGETQTQINSIWAQYSVKYTYDLDGNRISQTDQNGNTTLYYYDVDGRLRFTVNALGEVTESRYNSLGELTDSISYANRIATATLTRGALTSVLQNEVTAAANPALDSHLSYTYNSDGQVQTTTNADGEVTTDIYNAFGEVRLLGQTISSTQSVTTAYTYDGRGLLASTQSDINALDITTSKTYDAFGRLTSTTDGNGNTTRYVYDNLGRVTQTIDPLGGSTQSSYDSFGRVLSSTDADGNTTTYSYNDSTLTETTTDPNGNVTTTVDNREGQQSSVTAAGNTTTYTYDANGNLKTVSDDLGQLESITYDAAGRKLTDTDALGTTTTYTYDNANRISTQTVDSAAGGLNLVTSYIYDGEGRVTQLTEPNGRVTTTQYDGAGNVLKVTVDPSGLNLVTSYTYDLLGNVLTETQGAGSANPLITQYVYDDLGRKIEQIVDPTALGGKLNRTTQYFYDADGNLTREINASRSSTWYVYDTDDRLQYTIDALGGVSGNQYDADGRVISTRRYATPISTSGLGNVVQNISVTADPGVDNWQQTIYDGDGNAIYTINAVGGVTHYEYDARGDVTFQQTYSNQVGVGVYTTASQVTAALAAVGSTASAIGQYDEVSRTLYNQRGEAIFLINSVGGVTENTYDNAGDVTSTTQFATLYPSGGATDLTDVQNWASTNAGNSQNRVTKFWYDSTGRLRFQLDAAGYLTETQYNDAARTQTVIAYVSQPTIGAGATLSDVAAAIQLVAANGYEKTTTTYDVAGRVSSIVDADGYTQSFQYDAVGNKISYTNQNGATWTYQYDADHDLLVEIDPGVSVTSVTGGGSASNNSLTASTTTGVQLQTVYTYDNMGNVLTTTQAANTSQAATTTYNYDALGRQTEVIYPTVGVYNSSADNPNDAGTAVGRVETATALTTTTAYDTLGNAYRNQDVSGNYSYKVYNAAGQVVYEVDADNYVTAYTYDAFGNALTEKRYANALTSALPTNSATLAASDVASRLNADPNADRTITSKYDAMNRVVSVQQPLVFNFDSTNGVESAFSGSPTTLTQYDAFGDVVLTREQVGANSYANTYDYYDQRGLKIAEIDPLGYITTYKYDAFQNLSNEDEYSKALAAGSWSLSVLPTPTATTPSSSPNDPAGYDRDTVYTYDGLNRKTSDSLQNYQYYYISDEGAGVLTQGVTNQTTYYQYDGVGNTTEVTNAQGSTFTYYDALGRVIAVAAPRRNIDGSSTNGVPNNVEVTPLTELYRDALGNLVEQVQCANDAGVIAGPGGAPPVVASSPNDRITVMVVDALGRVLQTQDAKGQESYVSYDARGDIAKEWQYVTAPGGTTQAIVKIHQYDNLGNQTLLMEPEQLTGVGTAATVVCTETTYDAFGEMVGEGTYYYGQTLPRGGSFIQTTYEYDQAGRLWRTNSGGVTTIDLFNLAGKATVKLTSQTVDLSSNNASLAGESATFNAALQDSTAANTLAGTMRTETMYNLDGQVIGQRAPQFTIGSTQSLIDAQPTISTLTTTVPPGAIYQLIQIGNYGPYLDVPPTIYIINPSPISEGGGYIQTSPPSAAYPQGQYTQVAAANYQLSQSSVLHWATPADVDTVATVTYWPTSNPSDTSTVIAAPVAAGQVGISIQGLSGTYGYTISYTRSGATSAYATQTGTFNTSAATVSVNSSNTLSSVTAAPTTTQTLDRWGNVLSVTDASGNLTQYAYNQDNKLTLTISPMETVLETVPAIQSVTTAPMASNYYDQAGDLIETKDGNDAGGVATYNNVGQLLDMQDADSGAYTNGAITRYVYNIFGDQIQVTDQLGYITRDVYDKDNELVTTAQELTTGGAFANTASPGGEVNPDLTVVSGDAANVIIQNYGYDAAGRRTSVQNGDGNTTLYWYDTKGDVIQVQTPLGYDTQYWYDVYGNKREEIDADGSTQDWTYNAYGQLTSSTGLWNSDALYGAAGGETTANPTNTPVVTGYAYNYAGELTQQTNNVGQNQSFQYDAAGHLTVATDSGTAAAGSGLANSSTTSTYVYNSAGQQVRETVVVNGYTMQDTIIGYDPQGRIATLDDPEYRLTYSYDPAGNRTEISDTYLDHNRNSVTQNLYYSYDEDNHVLIDGGVSTGGILPSIEITAAQGTQLTYDAKGERATATTAGQVFEDNEGTISLVNSSNGLATQYYSYDGAGRLAEVDLQGIQSGTEAEESLRSYNKEGDVTTEYTTTLSGSATDNKIITSYDADGRTLLQTTTDTDNGETESVVSYGDAELATIDGVQYWTQGYDPAGVLRGYAVDTYANGVEQYETDYSFTYRLGSSYEQTSETAVSTRSSTNTGTGVPGEGNTSYTYNVDDQLVQFTDSVTPTNDRYFANDIDGDVLITIQGNFDGANGDLTLTQAWQSAVNRTAVNGNNYNAAQAQYFFFANGKNVGTFGQLQNSSGNFIANFDVNYTPISQTYPASVPSQTVVQAGDTLRIIAQRVFGDDSLWYLIADENGLTVSPNAALTVGEVLKIPNSVVSLHNNASTYKPFDPSEALGDTTPTQPTPPPPSQSGGGCGVLGEVLMVVVAIVVTYVTAGAASEAAGSLITTMFGADAAATAAGTVAAGALAVATTAAAASIASQAVGIAIGQQSGFSWQEVGVAALTAGLTQGTPLGSIGTAAGGYLGLALQGVINSVVDQGTEIALGEQHGFNWSQVALAAVSAPADAEADTLSGAIVGGATSSFLSPDEEQFLSGFTNGLTNIGVRLALGGKVDVESAAANAFGTALGNGLVEEAEEPELGSFTPQQQADFTASINDSAASAIDSSNIDIQQTLAAEQSMMDVNQQVAADNLGYTQDVTDAYNSEDNPGADLQNMAYDIGYGLQDNPNQGLPSAASLLQSASTLPQINYPSDGGGGLTLQDLYAARDAIAGQPSQGVPSGVRLFDADALNYTLAGAGGAFPASQLSSVLSLESDLRQAMGAAPGAAQLVAEFGPDATPMDKLNGAIQISGGHFGDDAAQNLLDQINSGANALNLTYTRGQSEQYFQSTYNLDQLRSQVYESFAGTDASSAAMDQSFSGLVDNLRSSDASLPPTLNITENGINRSIDSAVNQAMLVANIASLGEVALSSGLRASEVTATEAVVENMGNLNLTSPPPGSGIASLGELNSNSATPAGRYSAADINSNGLSIVLTDPADRATAQNVINQGDPTGALTESLVDSAAAAEGLTPLSGGKYGSNNGFDNVFKTSDGSVLLLDSKQLPDGAANVSTDAAGGTTQMSDAWVQEVLSKLDSTSDAYQAVDSAMNSGTLVKGIIGVDRASGNLTMFRVK